MSACVQKPRQQSKKSEQCARNKNQTHHAVAALHATTISALAPHCGLCVFMGRKPPLAGGAAQNWVVITKTEGTILNVIHWANEAISKTRYIAAAHSGTNQVVLTNGVERIAHLDWHGASNGCNQSKNLFFGVGHSVRRA